MILWTITEDGWMEPLHLRINPEESEYKNSADVRESIETIAGIDGALRNNSYLDPLPLTFVLRTPDGLSQKSKQSFKDRLYSDWSKALNDGVRLFDKKTSRFITAYPTGKISIAKDYATWMEFQVQLKALDPYWYSLQRSVDSEGKVRTNGNTLTDCTITFENTTSKTVSGACVIANGVRYEYLSVIPPQNKIVVSSETEEVARVYTGGMDDAFFWYNRNFLRLAPGEDVEIMLDCYPGVTAKIEWRDKWQ